MKVICPTCEQAFELSSVVFAKESGVVSEKGGGFSLTPKHPPKDGKESSAIVSSVTGEVMEKICNGSLRPNYRLTH
jgi:hypothetical protein